MSLLQGSGVRLAVVVPTFNERDNVAPLLERLGAALAGIPHEILFVDDDSSDGTAAVIRSIAQSRPAGAAPIHVLQRIGRRGLSSACIEGMLATSADYIAVIDADLQHDETILPVMYQRAVQEALDLVVGSRHIEGGAIDGGMTAMRTRLSGMGKRLSQGLYRNRLSDPMSGFFLVRRGFFERIAHRLSGTGFKILLDIVLSGGDDLRIGEVAYSFRPRQHGSSKLDVLVGLEYVELLLDKLIGSRVSVRFLLFCLVGAFGAVLHLLILAVLLQVQHIGFIEGQFIAAALVMVLNYSLNNAVSYRDRRRKGLRYFTGLLYFSIACSLGLLANVSIATDAYRLGMAWPLAAMIGLIFGAVWNYGVTSVTTWRDNKKHIDRVAKRRLEVTVAQENPNSALL